MAERAQVSGRNPHPESGRRLIKREQSVAGGNEAQEFQRAISKQPLSGGPLDSPVEAAPGVDKPQADWIRADVALRLLQRQEQAMAAVEQGIEQVFPKIRIWRRACELLYGKNHEGIPVIQRLLPSRDVRWGS